MFRIGHSSDKKGTNTVMGYVAPRFLYRTMVSKVFMVSPQNIQIKAMYTGSLAPAVFSGAVFTCAHFQKIVQISSLCNFHYISEGIPSLMRFWLLMT